MWPWVLIALLASLVTGFLLGVLTTRHSLDAATALQQNAAQLLDLRHQQTAMRRLWALLGAQEGTQKKWMDRLERMDMTQAQIVKALHRLGGITLAPTVADHGKLTIGSRPASEPPPPSSPRRDEGHI